MNKLLKNIIQKSIDHHLRMQEWAKTQKPYSIFDSDKMMLAIGEDWYDTSCALCKKFYIKCITKEGKLCPLFKKFGKCEFQNKKNYWHKLVNINKNKNKNWKYWLKWDKRFVEQIKSLLED